MPPDEHMKDTAEPPVRNRTGLVFATLAVLTGIAIAWIDTRPGWDDTGVSVGLVFLSSALWGVLAPKRPWLTALAVGMWIPLANVVMSGNFGSVVALAIAFVGAYAGAGVRRVLQRDESRRVL
jgi:hypothetical protein